MNISCFNTEWYTLSWSNLYAYADADANVFIILFVNWTKAANLSSNNFRNWILKLVQIFTHFI